MRSLLTRSSTTPSGRRTRRPRPWAQHLVAIAAWGSVVAFVLLTLGPALLGRGVFLGTDVLPQFDPWMSQLERTPLTNTWIGDTIDFYVPQSVLLADSTRAGQVAWWNPYVTGGTPLGSLPNVALFSPMSWAWLVVPATYAPIATKLIEVTVAVLGMTLLARRLNLSAAAGAVGGLIYVSSGFMIAWTNWPHTRVAALIPLVFWAVDRLIVLRRWRDTLPVALVLVSMLLLGFPAVVGYAGYAVVAYCVIRLVSLRARLRDWLRAALLGTCATVLGLALSAWQLLPFAVEATSTIDFAAREQTIDKHLSWNSIASTLVPQMIGEVRTYDMSKWLSAYNPVESFSYLGAGALVLVCTAIVLRPRRGSAWVPVFAVGGAVASVWLVYQGGAALGVVQHLPVFSNNSIGRLRVLVGFLAALAAAYGFHTLHARLDSRRSDTVSASDDDPRRSGRTLALAVARWSLVAVILGGVALMVVHGLDLVPATVRESIGQDVLVATVAFAACALLVLLAAATRRHVLIIAAGVLLPVVIVTQAVPVARTWWPVSDEETFYPTTATHQFLTEHIGHDRYVPVNWTMLAGTSSYYKLRVATGHAFHTPEWRALLVTADEDAMASRTNSAIDMDGMLSPVMDRMAVRYGVVSPHTAIIGPLVASGPAVIDADLGPVVTTAPITGPLRGVPIGFPAGLTVEGTALLRLRVETLEGTVLTESMQAIASNAEPFGAWVALAAEDVGSTQQIRLVLSVEGATSLVLASDGQGNWTPHVVRPDDDGLKVVHAGDATVYERETAAPRIRWAPDELLVTDEDERLALIASGELDPDTVILENSEDEQGVSGDAQASVDIVEDSGNVIRAQVDADGAGWLVIADSLQDRGWVASVDREATPLVDADQAMGAVYVPEGSHVVELRYEAPGLRTGALVSFAALGVMVLSALTLLVTGIVRRRRSAPTFAAASDGTPEPRATAPADEAGTAL